MKIEHIELYHVEVPLEEPFAPSWIPGYPQNFNHFTLIRLTTDEGIVGYGEAASFGGPLTSTATIVEKELGPRLIGQDPMMTERLWKMLYYQSWQHARGGVVICAISGIDIALWDIVGQALDTPLYKLFGGYDNRVRAYASAGFYKRGKGTKEIAAELGGHAKDGFTAVKMKVGRNRTTMNPLEVMPDPDFFYTVDEDLERVTAVREAIGPDVRLLVDANAAWDVYTAMKFGRELDKLNAFAFEEPICTDNLEGSVHLARSLDMKIAGYETEQLAFNFKRLIESQAVDIVQPDLTWGGGFTECNKIAAMAYAAHKEVAPHCFSSAVCLAASLHFLCSVSNPGMLELDRNPNGLRTDIVNNPLSIDEDGFVTVPEKPGLGLDINEDAVEEYRVHE